MVSVIIGFILLIAMNVGITPDKVFPGPTEQRTVAGYEHALNSSARLHGRAAGPDLDRRRRPDRRPDHPAPRHRRPVLLRHVLGHGELADDLRVLARRGDPRQSSFWHRINQRTRTPTNSIWLAAVGAFILGLPYLYSATAYAAVTSIAVIGLYVAYVAPVFLRLAPALAFQAGPWTLGSLEPPDRDRCDDLGRLHRDPVHAPAGPAVNISTFNYTPIVFLVVIGGVGLWWVVSAKNWFKGPKVQGSAEELAAIERDLEIAGA